MGTVLSIAHFMLGALVVLPLSVLPFVGAAEARVGNGPGVRGLARATTVFGAVGLFIGLMGLLLVSYLPRLSILTPWLGISCLLYGLALTLTLGATAPRLRLASDQLAGGTAPTTVWITVSGAATTVALLGVVLLMMFKP